MEVDVSNGSFSIISRIRSFFYAFRGVWTMLSSQHNAWIHALATVVVTSTGLYFGISRVEWCAVVLCFGAVWTAEALNTAFESLADVASPEFHPMVEKAKDVAAAAVLMSAIGSVVIAIIIFEPHFAKLFAGK